MKALINHALDEETLHTCDNPRYSTTRCRGRGRTMLGQIILIAFQFATALLGAPFILRAIPISGDLKILVHATVFAVVVGVVGLVGSFALKDVNLPSSKTLAAALAGALIGAASLFIPGLLAAIPLKFDRLYLPLIGAIIGYMVRR
jgi:hypothetical protein